MSSLVYWTRLIFGGLCLPVVFPYLVYKLYKSRYSNLNTGGLEGKVVLITGASSGLGEALAHRFFQAGCRVILASRRVTELERVKENLMSSTEPFLKYEPAILQLDLGDLQSIQEKAEEALSFHGKIDILINNGGISYRGEVLSTSIDVDVKLMMVNYLGHVALTKALLSSMVASREGSIVAVSSVQGKIAIPFRSAYAASKHAMQAFCDTLRAEIEDKNIHVCVVSPGYIRTNLSLNALTGSGATYGAMDETTATGMDPKAVADAIFVAVIEKQKDVILSPIGPRMAIIIRTLLPWLYFILMKSRAKRLHHQDRAERKQQ